MIVFESARYYLHADEVAGIYKFLHIFDQKLKMWSNIGPSTTMVLTWQVDL